jgi:MazG family protein
MHVEDPSRIDTLLGIMARLRDPQRGCPWDVQQDFRSIAPYTIEEAYEVADAIVRDDMVGLCDELGDLLLQVVFHARMAEEAGRFAFPQVVQAIVEKMVRRHPHVFGDEDVDDPQAVNRNWEAIKERERQEGGRSRDSVLDDVSAGQSSLGRALKLQRRAAGVGFDWRGVGPVLDKLREETEELQQELQRGPQTGDARVEAELGDVLFSVVNLARHLGVDPEMALAGSNRRFEARFRHLERTVARDGDPRSLSERSPDELDALWQDAKRNTD